MKRKRKIKPPIKVFSTSHGNTKELELKVNTEQNNELIPNKK